MELLSYPQKIVLWKFENRATAFILKWEQNADFSSGISKSDCVFGSPSSPSPLRPAGTFAQVNLAHAWARSPWVISLFSEHLLSASSSAPGPQRGAGQPGPALLPRLTRLAPPSALSAACGEACYAPGWQGVLSGFLSLCLAFQLTCKVLPSTCLILALLGCGYSFKAVFKCYSFRFCKPVYFIF